MSTLHYLVALEIPYDLESSQRLLKYPWNPNTWFYDIVHHIHGL